MVFAHELIVDNSTLTRVDLGAFGGALEARALIDDDDRLRAVLSEPDTGKEKLEIVRERKKGEETSDIKKYPSKTTSTLRKLEN